MTIGRLLNYHNGFDAADINFNIERLKDVAEFHAALKELLDEHAEDLGEDVAKKIMQSFVRQIAFANIDALVEEHTMSPQQLGAKRSAETRKKKAAATAKKAAPKVAGTKAKTAVKEYEETRAKVTIKPIKGKSKASASA